MLTGKQKRYLRSKANILKAIVYIGKEGLTGSVVNEIDDVLKAKELVKVSVSGKSPIKTKKAAKKAAESTGAEVAQIIGRKFLLYRKSDTTPEIVLP